MGLLDNTYLIGVTRALQDAGIVKTAEVNVNTVATLAELKLREKFGSAIEPTPQEMQQVTQSGLTENDIQSAAKVVQVVAEMKQQADAAAMGMPSMPGQQAQAPAGQPPLPPAPAGAQGMGGGMPPGGMPPDMGGGMPPGGGGGMPPGGMPPGGGM